MLLGQAGVEQDHEVWISAREGSMQVRIYSPINRPGQKRTKGKKGCSRVTLHTLLVVMLPGEYPGVGVVSEGGDGGVGDHDGLQVEPV